MEVPEEVINDIIGNLQMGWECFIHTKTLEVVTYPDDLGAIDEEYAEIYENDMERVQSDKNFYEIVKMPPSEAFEVMEEFIWTVEDPGVKERLENAIRRPKPFANFNREIDHTEIERKQWFAFRHEKYTEWVKRQLKDA